MITANFQWFLIVFFSPLCFWLRSNGIVMCCIVYLRSPEPVHCWSEVFLGEGGFVSMRTGFMWYCVLGTQWHYSQTVIENTWKILSSHCTRKGEGNVISMY